MAFKPSFKIGTVGRQICIWNKFFAFSASARAPRALGAGGNHRKLASRHRQRAPLQSNKLSHGRISSNSLSDTLQITFGCDEDKMPAKLVEIILEYHV